MNVMFTRKVLEGHLGEIIIFDLFVIFNPLNLWEMSSNLTCT